MFEPQPRANWFCELQDVYESARLDAEHKRFEERVEPPGVTSAEVRHRAGPELCGLFGLRAGPNSGFPEPMCDIPSMEPDWGSLLGSFPSSDPVVGSC